MSKGGLPSVGTGRWIVGQLHDQTYRRLIESLLMGLSLIPI